jgi:hypothetical protein
MRRAYKRADWRSLGTVRGNAERVPRLIDEAMSEDAEQRVRARRELDDRLVHQGMFTDACPPAIALLTEHLKRTRTPDRAGLLRFVVSLTVGAPDLYLHGSPIREVHLEGPKAEQEWGARYVMLARHCYAAGYEACDVARRLLLTGSEEERATAAYLLTFYPSYGKRLGWWMVQRLRLESAEVVRAGLLLCLAYWARWRTWRRPPPELRACLRGGSAFVRASAAMALSGYAALDDEVFGELERALHLPRERRLPWSGGRLGDLATVFLADGTPRSTNAVVQWITSASVGPSDGTPFDDSRAVRAQLLARTVFSRGGYVPEHQIQDMPSLVELTEAQLSVLHMLATIPERTFQFSSVGGMLQGNGLPATQPKLRRYLGLSAPGSMDVVVVATVNGESVRWPAHVWARRMGLGTIPREAVIEAFASHPSADELLAALQEGLAAYDLGITGSLDRPAWVRFTIDVLVRRRMSPTKLEQAIDGVSSTAAHNKYAVWASLGALARLVPELPATYAGLVSRMKQSAIAGQLPEVLQSIEAATPAGRRDSS